MENTQKTLLKIEMEFSTAFKIGLGFALAWITVFIIPWIIIMILVIPAALATSF